VEGITMKRIALFTVFLAGAAGFGYAKYPEQLAQFSDRGAQLAQRVWGNVEANPIPVYIAIGTFLLTVVYLRVKGKTLRESVEVAATRVTVVPVPAKEADDEPLVVKRAKARATWAQLMTDQVALQNRSKHLPEAIRTAQKDACYTEQSVADAERALKTKQGAHDEAVAKLDKLCNEKAACDTELKAIDVELKKLNALV
jgi:hypothetical protein